MNDFYSLLWAASGALLGIVGATLTVANHFSSRFEALGDRIDKVSADLDKLHSLEVERRASQLEAQTEYREKVDYLIHSNRERGDHHRKAVEAKLSGLRDDFDRQMQDFRRELKDFRGYLSTNSDYVVRKRRQPPED